MQIRPILLLQFSPFVLALPPIEVNGNFPSCFVENKSELLRHNTSVLCVGFPIDMAWVTYEGASGVLL